MYFIKFQNWDLSSELNTIVHNKPCKYLKLLVWRWYSEVKTFCQIKVVTLSSCADVSLFSSLFLNIFIVKPFTFRMIDMLSKLILQFSSDVSVHSLSVSTHKGPRIRKRRPHPASSPVYLLISEPTVRQCRDKIIKTCKQTRSRKYWEIYFSYFAQSIKF